MKTWHWQAFLVLLLVALSTVLYLAHYAVFRDAHHIWLYLLGDIAFLPLEVLLVVLVLHRLLDLREKRSMFKKLNMVIGAFFSEVGTQLLGRFRRFDARAGELAAGLADMDEWSKADFARAAARLETREPVIVPRTRANSWAAAPHSVAFAGSVAYCQAR